MLSRFQSLVAGWGILLLLGLCPGPAGAQPDSSRADLEAKTVEVSAEVYAGNKTPQEARRQAIDRAQAEAVRRAIGTQVQAQRQRSQIETGDEVVSRFSQVVRTGASGRVVDSEVLSERRPKRGGKFFHRVRIRATVEPATGHPDPGFKVDLRLNDAGRVFVDRGAKTDSDEIIAEIEVSKDAHLTLFEVTTDTLKVLWPNSMTKRHSMEPFVPADTTVEFPPPRLRKFGGLRFRAQVPAGRERVTRRLVVVATKQDVPFREIPQYEVEEDRTLKVRKTSIQTLNRWLVKIPLGQRALQSVTYDVVRASDR